MPGERFESGPGKDDPYEALGLNKDASFEEVQEAWRRLANQHHPQKNIGNEVAASELFDEAKKAYDKISDSMQEKRGKQEKMRSRLEDYEEQYQALEEKLAAERELGKKDLAFLYDTYVLLKLGVPAHLYGADSYDDPDMVNMAMQGQYQELSKKIKEIVESRKEFIRKDLALVFDCDEHEVATELGLEFDNVLTKNDEEYQAYKTDIEARLRKFKSSEGKTGDYSRHLNDETRVFFGNVMLNPNETNMPKNLRYVVGNVDLGAMALNNTIGHFQNPKKPINDMGKLESIWGSLNLLHGPRVRSVEGLKEVRGGIVVDWDEAEMVGLDLSHIKTGREDTAGE